MENLDKNSEYDMMTLIEKIYRDYMDRYGKTLE